MPAETFSKPLEKILDGKCSYEYYDYTNDTSSQTKKTRICHVTLSNQSDYNKNVVLMIFTIRNQNGKWKIHSEGAKRMGTGDTVPLRNAAIKYANNHNWKYVSLAIASDAIPNSNPLSQYVISMESYTYGNETVYDLSNELDELSKIGNPDFYRFKVESNKKEYSFVFIKKEKLINYLNIIDNRAYNNSTIKRNKIFDYSITKGSGINKIFYGVPGCGKSYHIEYNILGRDKVTNKYDSNKYTEENVIRTTFYQDYSNTDFIGQILPKVTKDDNDKNIVEYIFNPGPFTIALIQAIKNPNQNIALVVEEINRGNAPAIFGDIFQLLDRDDNGVSEYGIVNVGVMDYLEQVNFGTNETPVYYTFKGIKIPGNMNIFATMNTSDQNVYTLDTAFIRRWEKEKIKNSFKDCTFAKTNVPGMDYTWQEFVTAINNHIAKHLEDLQVNEDKQIGLFFVKESLLGASPKKFAYKVFDYLWSDVAKLDHGIFFNHFDTLEALITSYEKEGVNVFKAGIFDKKETPQTVEEDESNE